MQGNMKFAVIVLEIVILAHFAHGLSTWTMLTDPGAVLEEVKRVLEPTQYIKALGQYLKSAITNAISSTWAWIKSTTKRAIQKVFNLLVNAIKTRVKRLSSDMFYAIDELGATLPSLLPAIPKGAPDLPFVPDGGEDDARSFRKLHQKLQDSALKDIPKLPRLALKLSANLTLNSLIANGKDYIRKAMLDMMYTGPLPIEFYFRKIDLDDEIEHLDNIVQFIQILTYLCLAVLCVCNVIMFSLCLCYCLTKRELDRVNVLEMDMEKNLIEEERKRKKHEQARYEKTEQKSMDILQMLLANGGPKGQAAARPPKGLKSRKKKKRREN